LAGFHNCLAEYAAQSVTRCVVCVFQENISEIVFLFYAEVVEIEEPELDFEEATNDFEHQ